MSLYKQSVFTQKGNISSRSHYNLMAIGNR